MKKQPSKNTPNAKGVSANPLAYLTASPSSVVPPPVVTSPQQLPLHALSWEDFERLCYRLAGLQSEIEHVQLYGIPGQNQQGIDIYTRVNGSKKYWVYQCKREKKFGKAKIKAVVKRFLEGSWADKTERFFICTSDSLRPKESADELERQNSLLTDRGISVIPWDADNLSVLLKDKPRLVGDFFGLGWVRPFCGIEPRDLPNQDIDIVAAEKKVRDAATRALENWKIEYRFAQQQLIELNLRLEPQKRHNEDPQTEKYNPISLTEFANSIGDFRHMVIKGEPGAGKTFMLLQIADKILTAEDRLIPIFISLKEWAVDKCDLFDFVAKHLSLVGIAISAYDLIVLNAQGRLLFLINGWNEVPVESIHTFTQKLNPIIRNSAETPFIITSRESEYETPFSNPVIVRIIPLNRIQRNEIIERNIPDDANSLIARIEDDPKLHEITQTPLYLATLIRIFSIHKAIPNSRYQIIGQFIEDSEREHHSSLVNAPSAGYHNDYLQNIASHFQATHLTGTTETVVMGCIGGKSVELQNKGYIGSAPNAKKVLSGLYSHHILIKAGDSVRVVRFSHHQIQEWYASNDLYNLICEIISQSDSNKKWHFQLEQINDPFNEQSLLFLVERLAIGSDNPNDKKILLELIQWTIPIDLYFACRMVANAGEVFRKRIPGMIEEVLRSMWQSSNQQIRDYALSCMLVTENPIFADVVVPLIEDDDEQVRLRTYRHVELFPVSCLGEDWWKVYSSWDVDRRTEFVLEVGYQSYTLNSKVIDYITDNDTTSEVRIALCQVYERNAIEDRLDRLLRRINWSHVLRSDLIHWLPRQIVVKHLHRLRRAVIKESDQSVRIAGLIYLGEIGDEQSIKTLITEVEGGIECEDYRVLKVLTLCHPIYPDWVLQCLVARLCEGRLWDELYSRMNDERSDWNSETVKQWLSGADHDTWVRIFDFVLDETRELRKQTEVLAAVNPDFIAEQILQERTNPISEDKEPQNGLQLCARYLPIGSKVKAVLNWLDKTESPITYDFIRTMTEYLASEEYNSRSKHNSIDPDLRDRVRDNIIKWGNLNLSPNDHGRLRAELATLLGRIGTTDDLGILSNWITKDKQRDEEEYKNYVSYREDWLRSEKHTFPLISYTKYSWQNQYIDAIKRIPSKKSTILLKRLLDEIEYIEAASRVLVELANLNSNDNQNWFGLRTSPRDIAESRNAVKRGESISGVNANLSKVIKKAIMRHLRDVEEDGSRGFKRDSLARAAYWFAHICDQSDVNAILKICAKSSSSYDVLSILERIISRGIAVPGRKVWDILESKCAESEMQCEEDYSNNDFSSIHRYIQMLLMSDNPVLGVQKLRKLSPKCLVTYQIRGTVSALGACNCKEALEFLLELQSKPKILKFCYSEWLEALSYYTDPRVRKIFTCHVKHPKVSLFLNGRQDRSLYLEGALVNLLAVDEAFGADIKSLCESAVSNDERDLLASVVEKTSHARKAFLSLALLKDDSSLPIPVQLYRIVDDQFKKKIPVSEYNSYYEESKASNELREALYSVAANDPTRRQCALKILVYIDLMRIEKGRPTDEPRHPNLNSNVHAGISWMQMD